MTCQTGMKPGQETGRGNPNRKRKVSARGAQPSPPLVCHDLDGAEVVAPVASAQLPVGVGAPGVEQPLVGERHAVAVARHHLMRDKGCVSIRGPHPSNEAPSV